MDPVVVLGETRLAVEPGEQVRTTAIVRNAGTIVEQYQLQVLGIAAGWSDVLPREVSVLPGGEATVEVVFRPPRDSMTPAGDVPFGFRCVSLEHPDRIAVAEGDVAVGAVIDADAQILPTQSHGRWSGRHKVQLHNRGTVAVHFQLAVTDPAEALGFALTPEVLQVPPGGRGEASLQVRTRSPFLRGQPKPLPFQVTYQRLGARPDEAGTGVIPATFEQRPILSKGVIVLGGLVVAGIAALIALNLRGGDGPDVSVPPPSPRVEAAKAIGSDKVQLVWARNPNATGYRVEKLLAGSETPTVEDSKEVPGERSAFTWTDLPAGAEHCFQVVAINDAGASAPSEPSCVEMPSANGPTAEPPSGLEVVAQGQQVRLTWQPADERASTLILMDSIKAAEVAAGKSTAALPVQTPGEHCFSVQGQVGDALSEPSEDKCVTIGDTQGSGNNNGSPTTNGNTTPTTASPNSRDLQGFFVIYDFFPADDPASNGRALQRVGELQAAGVRAALIDNAASPVLQSINQGGVRGWVIYADGFRSHEDAVAYCDEQRQRVPDTVVSCPAPI